MRFEYLIATLVVLVIYLAILKLNKEDKLDFNKLVEYLGGKENILKTQSTLSRFIVRVVDSNLVNKAGIKKLGAQGIVELDNEFKIILGNNSKKLKEYIDELK